MLHKLIFLLALMPFVSTYAVDSASHGKHKSKQCVKKSKPRLAKKCFNLGTNYTPNITLNQYIPTYRITNIDETEKRLTTHDTTVWKVSNSSFSIAAKWKSGDSIILSPNKGATYCLTNKETKEFVVAYVCQSPSEEGAVRATFIEYHRNPMVRLTDGSQWTTDKSDELQKWAKGSDIILQGINTSWFGASNILINVSKGNYILAWKDGN